MRELVSTPKPSTRDSRRGCPCSAPFLLTRQWLCCSAASVRWTSNWPGSVPSLAHVSGQVARLFLVESESTWPWGGRSRRVQSLLAELISVRIPGRGQWRAFRLRRPSNQQVRPIQPSRPPCRAAQGKGVVARTEFRCDPRRGAGTPPPGHSTSHRSANGTRPQGWQQQRYRAPRHGPVRGAMLAAEPWHDRQPNRSGHRDRRCSANPGRTMTNVNTVNTVTTGTVTSTTAPPSATAGSGRAPGW